MTNEKLFKEISGIDTDLVLEAAPCDKKKKTTKRPINIMRYAAVCAAFALIVAGLGMFVHFNNENATPKYYAPVAKLCFDVNPGIEVDIDGNNVVVYVNAVNSDGENVIGGVDFKGKSIEEAALLLVESMVEKGYINKETNCLLLTIESERDMQELEDKLRTEIAVSIKEVEGKIIVQKIEKSEDVSQIAEAYGITVGKAKLIKDISGKHSELSLKKLAGMTITQLSQYIDAVEARTEYNYELPREIKAPENCMSAYEAFNHFLSSSGYEPQDIRQIKMYSADIRGKMYEFVFYYRTWNYHGTMTVTVNGETGNWDISQSEGGGYSDNEFTLAPNIAYEMALDYVRDKFGLIERGTISDEINSGVPYFKVVIDGKNHDNVDVKYTLYLDGKTGELLEMKKN